VVPHRAARPQYRLRIVLRTVRNQMDVRESHSIGSQNRRLVRWLHQGTLAHQQFAELIIHHMLPPLRSFDLVWVDVDFLGNAAQPNAVLMERSVSDDRIDFVEAIFDRGRKKRLQIAVGSKWLSDFTWIRGGYYAPRVSDRESDHWWSPPFWTFGSVSGQKTMAASIASGITQIEQYLRKGEVGPNIVNSKIYDNT
jgi:hypothetical protein